MDNYSFVYRDRRDFSSNSSYLADGAIGKHVPKAEKSEEVEGANAIEK